MNRALRYASRFALTLTFSVASALVVAVVVGITDLYLTGHSLPSLGRPWIELPAFGVAMSRGDVVLLAAVFGVGAATWWVSTPLMSVRER